MTDITSLDATVLCARLRDGSLGAEAVMAAFLDRIEAVNPAVNAIVSLRPRDELLAEARAMDAGPRRGALHGLPMAVKDLAATRGIRTTWGSPLFADFVPEADEILPARLRGAGAILIGKTNTPEMGLGSHTFNPVFGATGNPYDLGRTPGGSSGGAAAALAARLVALADGSDMMGSLRNPAAFCNVYGFRPTWGLVPSDPEGDTFLHQLSTDGPMARSPADIALLLEVLAGPDPRLPYDLGWQPWTEGIDEAPGRLRIGWLGDWGGALPFEAGVLETCETALDDLRGLGHEVLYLAPPHPLDQIWQSWITLRSWSVAAGQKDRYEKPEMRAGMKPALIWEIERGLALSAMQVHAASVLRSRWFEAAMALFSRVDVLAMPSAQVWPFPTGWTYPTEIAGRQMDTYHRWMETVVPVSLLGLPSLNVPAGFGQNGLPMGLQLFGPKGADHLILRLGQAYHRATLWPERRPPAL